MGFFKKSNFSIFSVSSGINGSPRSSKGRKIVTGTPFQTKIWNGSARQGNPMRNGHKRAKTMAKKNNWTAERAFSEYHERILRYIRAKIPSPQEAEDVCSAVFLKVQSKLCRYDPEKAPFSAWIYAIARNAVTDHYRLYRRTEPLREEIAATEDVSDHLLREEMLEELAAALESLPRQECDLIVLHYYSGIELKNIASRMGVSYSTVKRLHAKALLALKQHISLQ